MTRKVSVLLCACLKTTIPTLSVFIFFHYVINLFLSDLSEAKFTSCIMQAGHLLCVLLQFKVNKMVQGAFVSQCNSLGSRERFIC